MKSRGGSACALLYPLKAMGVIEMAKQLTKDHTGGLACIRDITYRYYRRRFSSN